MIARRTTRKIITRAIAFIIAGAVVNVAVAWGTALRLPAPFERGTTFYTPHKDGELLLQRRQGDVRVTAHRRGRSMFVDQMTATDQQTFDRMLPRSSSFRNLVWVDDRLESALRLGGTATMIEHSHGWPLLAMSGSMTVAHVSSQPTIVATNGVTEIGPITIWPIATAPSYRRLLPLLPIWSGFAINTVFYAAILWLMFATPRVLRRWRRIKRGLCPACAYPVGASEVCSECGKRVKGALT